MESIDSATLSKDPDQAPVERYFQPPSQTTKTISPVSIVSAVRMAPAKAAPDDIPQNMPLFFVRILFDKNHEAQIA